MRVIATADNTAPFEDMSQQWRTFGFTVSDLTGPRFEPHTSRSSDERVTAPPTGKPSLKSYTVTSLAKMVWVNIYSFPVFDLKFSLRQKLILCLYNVQYNHFVKN